MTAYTIFGITYDIPTTPTDYVDDRAVARWLMAQGLAANWLEAQKLIDGPSGVYYAECATKGIRIGH
jgi:hypothetical protein